MTADTTNQLLGTVALVGFVCALRGRSYSVGAVGSLLVPNADLIFLGSRDRLDPILQTSRCHILKKILQARIIYLKKEKKKKRTRSLGCQLLRQK